MDTRQTPRTPVGPLVDGPQAAPSRAAELPRVGPVRGSLAAFAALMTLPYLGLKLAWLSGSRIGLQDPDFGTGTGMTVLNSLTLGLDVVALCLAAIFWSRRGIRAPAWLVLPPMWIGAGLLGQILVALPLSLVQEAVEPSRPSTGELPPIEGWVYAMVYAGFAGLGIGLLGSFAIYAWQRWGQQPLPEPGAAGRRALAAAAGLVLAAGAAHLVLTDLPLGTRVLDLVVAVATAAALLALRTRLAGRAGRFVVAGAFIGTGALVSWATYITALQLIPNDLVGLGGTHWPTVGASLARAAAGFAGMGALALRLRRR